MRFLVFYAYFLAGEDCGVAPLPNHTSSILVRTLLINPALDITLSLAERLVIVDSGCGRETGAQWFEKFLLPVLTLSPPTPTVKYVVTVVNVIESI